MASMKDALRLYEDLKKQYGADKLDACRPLLAKLKVALMELSFLPNAAAASQQELLLAREVLEMGVQWSVKVSDPEAFGRYMAQLKAYYFDYGSANMPESPYMYELLGLNLLRLLSENRIAEFHTELERLEPSLLKENIYIQHPAAIEQYLMEGSYNKVFLARSNVPSSSYLFFIDILMETIRDEIARGCEKAYERLSLAEATKLLFLKTAKETRDFAEEKMWDLEGDAVLFNTGGEASGAIPAEKMIRRTLGYAVELERIV